jgi:hypothetical protein
MAYVTSIERLAKEEGKAEGRIEGQIGERAAMLIRVLEWKSKSTVTEELVARIRGTTDLAVLERWFSLALDVSSPEEFQQRMLS